MPELQNNLPLVSVVVPTHNRRRLLKKSIKSVLSQTYSNLEIIVVNDASSDGSEDYLKHLEEQDSRVHSVHNKKALGGAAARNIGIRNSQGEFIAFLDDDDEWLPEKTHKQVDFFQESPHVAVVSCWYHTRSESGEWVNSKPENLTFRDILWSNFPGSFSFCMIRRSVIEAGFYLNESLTNFQDWEFWLRVSQKHNIHILPRVLATYNDHYDARISTSMKKKFLTYRWFLDTYGQYMVSSCLAYHRSHMILCKIKAVSKRPKRIDFFAYFMTAPMQIIVLFILKFYFQGKNFLFHSPMPSYPYYLKKVFERSGK